MSAKPPFEPVIADTDVLIVTPAGQKELKSSGTGLSRLELELMVLTDGSSTVAQVKGRVKDTAAAEVATALKSLVSRKLLGMGRDAAPVGGPDVIDVGDFLKTGAFYVSQKSPTPELEGEANEGTKSLQRDGYYVSIARRATTERKAPPGAHLTALIVEDEPHLAKLLRSLLSIEGFETRVAGNRAEIIEALRTPPVPELVLLDVMLPDADGFELLVKLRNHPAFKHCAIVMLTAKANREAVLKGLAGGADGYLTKPFEVDVLMSAVQTVLGRSKA
jgi:two-component system OmpR family response regulator